MISILVHEGIVSLDSGLNNPTIENMVVKYENCVPKRGTMTPVRNRYEFVTISGQMQGSALTLISLQDPRDQVCLIVDLIFANWRKTMYYDCYLEEARITAIPEQTVDDVLNYRARYWLKLLPTKIVTKAEERLEPPFWVDVIVDR